MCPMAGSRRPTSPGPGRSRQSTRLSHRQARQSTWLSGRRPPARPPRPRRSRRRRAWAVPVIAVAALVVLGLLAGLLIWAPWKSPPLLRPAGLTAGPSTTSSVTFRWSRPATGPPPERYVILHDGQVAGSVPGTVTSYRGTGLAPATAYRYRVAAERGGQRSALSPVIVLTTATPPLSAARLQGAWTVSIKITQGASDLTGPRSWDETWQATPKCAAGPCDVRLSGGLNGYTFKTTLTRAGAAYRGRSPATCFRVDQGPSRSPSGPR